MNTRLERENIYLHQNRAIHKARAQLGMDLDDCREIARQLFGDASLSRLTVNERWNLIEKLKAMGARVYNPRPDVDPDEVYPIFLEHWQKRFPEPRPGYASPWQLAWIESLWEFNFTRGQGAKGLRRFIYRQTQSLEHGPVSDLAFLRDHHVEAVITPLKEMATRGN